MPLNNILVFREIVIISNIDVALKPIILVSVNVENKMLADKLIVQVNRGNLICD